MLILGSVIDRVAYLYVAAAHIIHR